MPRYLGAESVARLIGVGSEEFPKVIEDLGLNLEQAHRLQRLWVLRIHGRCVRCESQRGATCKCPNTGEKIGDNRHPTTVLDRLPPYTELMKVPCRKCREPASYTVRNALWRLKKKTDWDAFFRCSSCLEKAREERKKKRAAKKASKTTTKKKKVVKTKPLKPQAAPPKRRSSALTHRPFANLQITKPETTVDKQDQLR